MLTYKIFCCLKIFAGIFIVVLVRKKHDAEFAKIGIASNKYLMLYRILTQDGNFSSIADRHADGPGSGRKRYTEFGAGV